MNTHRTRTWMIVGSSPSASAFIDAALAAHPDATLITANAGIGLLVSAVPTRWPHHYWLSDHVACVDYARWKRAARAQGTIIYTLDRTPYGLTQRGMQDADVFLQLDEPVDGPAHYEPGGRTHPRLSGLICLQYAAECLPILAGVSHRIVLVGFDGYVSTPDQLQVDNFDGRLGKAAGAEQTRTLIEPFVRTLVAARRDIDFTLYGRPNYPLPDRVDVVGEAASIPA